ncbi:MAG: methyl-accepting chemotaxis protein [Colwellia sp.]|jgi:methyl-accepting chemotaxis protein
MLRNFKISRRLIIGFSLLVLILAISSLISIRQINLIEQQSVKIIDLRIPTAQASASILNGVNHALAALRGWMLLGKDKFKEERLLAWNKEINPALSTLEKMSKNWTNPENMVRLKELKTLLRDFSFEQQEIENIAQTLQNIPSIEMLYQQAVPQSLILSNEITAMINTELVLEATTKRKALLGVMADIRGSLGLSLANIRGFLLSGEQEYQEAFEKLWRKNTQSFNKLTSLQNLLNKSQKQSFSKFTTARAIFSKLPTKMINSRNGDDWNIANHRLGTKAAPLGFKIKEIISQMSINQIKLLNDDSNTMHSIVDDSVFLTGASLLVGSLIAIALSLVISRSIILPIKNMVDHLTLAANNNDLTVRFEKKGKDELSEVASKVNNMLSTFQKSLQDVLNASNQISVCAEETSVISSQVEQSTHEQVEQMESIATAINEMAMTVKEVAVSTLVTSDSSDSAAEMTKSGLQSMQATTNIIEQLAEIINQTTKTIAALEQSSINIAGVLEVINGIAEQTNLLALNAAIEAARAGEQGRGFAVVADEVRALASRTQQSTGEISEIVGLLQKNSTSAVTLMKESEEQVINVINSASSTGDALNTIADIITQINDMSTQIATASEQQEIVVEEININVVKINDKTQESSQAIVDVSKAGQELAKLSTGMQILVAQFKINNG